MLGRHFQVHQIVFLRSGHLCMLFNDRSQDSLPLIFCIKGEFCNGCYISIQAIRNPNHKVYSYHIYENLQIQGMLNKQPFVHTHTLHHSSKGIQEKAKFTCDKNNNRLAVVYTTRLDSLKNQRKKYQNRHQH